MRERRLHAHVSGRVQGVGFRFYTEERARRLGLSGWVRNLPDGTVEVLAEGPPDRLASLVEALESGPPGSRVAAVTREMDDARSDLGPFRIAY